MDMHYSDKKGTYSMEVAAHTEEEGMLEEAVHLDKSLEAVQAALRFVLDP